MKKGDKENVIEFPPTKTIESPSIVPEQPNKKKRKAPRRRLTAQELLEGQASLLKALFAAQQQTGMRQRVPKKNVQYVMGRRGYAPGHLDRIWKIVEGYERFYDSDFPKPIDLKSPAREWWLDELLAYSKKKYG